MVDEDAAKLEKKYLLWVASIVAFGRKNFSYQAEQTIRNLVNNAVNPTSIQIPDSMESMTSGIRLYAQIVRLSRFVYEHVEEIAPIIKKFQDYGEDDFIEYYNNHRKENA